MEASVLFLVSPTPSRSIQDYRVLVGEAEIQGILGLAEAVRGRSMLHINSTKYGGGVAEILKSLVPLLNSVGLKTSWKVMNAPKELFIATKQIHNGLQGMDLELTDSVVDTYSRFNELSALALNEDVDLVIIHDPQPAAMIDFASRNRGKSAWRCHIDLTNPDPRFWRFARGFVEKFDALIFSSERYLKKELKGKPVFIIPPSIDPLSEKNQPLPESRRAAIVEQYDVDPDAPIMTQVARFDPWKDPLGAVDIFRKVKQRVHNTQLLLIGSLADDDPEGVEWHSKSLKYAADARDVHILCNLSDLEVNALQRASSVMLQNSKREGFGLTVAEALWKGVPVVARNVGGIPLQVCDGVTGYLVDSLDEAASKIVFLMRNADVAKAMGARGRDHIGRNFLVTRELRDHLMLLQSLERL